MYSRYSARSSDATFTPNALTHWHLQNGASPRITGLETKSCTRIHCLKAASHQGNALRTIPRGIARQSWAVVLHFAYQNRGCSAVYHSGADVNFTTILAVQRAVIDGVLHQRLKQESRYYNMPHVLGHIPRNVQSSAMPCLQDACVFAKPLELLTESFRISIVKRVPKEIAQSDDQPARFFWIFRDESRDRVERVQQEMRL